MYFATKYFFNKKEHKEYNQKIKIANNEILYAIRPLIIDKKLPCQNSFASLLLSVSNKYGIKLKDLYNNESLANDLIAEILENPFLQTVQKEELCQIILKFKLQKNEKEANIIYIPKFVDTESRLTSYILAISSFAMILATTLLIAKETKSYEPSELEKRLFGDNIIVFITATLIPLVILSAMYTIRIFHKKFKRFSAKSESSKSKYF